MTEGERTSAKRAARNASEAAMLRAATDMLLAAPGVDVLGALKPVDVARRADPPRTTGAFYNIWPTQAEFRRALLDHVLSLDRFQVDLRTRQALEESLLRPELSLTDIVRTAANLNFDGLKDEPAMRLQQALWSQHAGDPEIRDRVKQLYSTISQALVPLYSALLDRSCRRMRAPYDLETLAVVLAALVEGLIVRWSVDPAVVPDDLGPPPGVPPIEGEPWGTFASVTYLIFIGMTEPIPSAGEQN
jgi:hypothetical protein